MTGKFLPVKEQLKVIKRGTVDLLPLDELEQKLERSSKTGKPLRIKQGFDPTATDIHLGHTVGIRKLKQFQDLGHQVVVIIGDYTGMVGDPSEKNSTRPRLTHEDVMENAKIVLEGYAKDLRENPDVKEFYLGVAATGTIKTYKDVKAYKRRKRWL